MGGLSQQRKLIEDRSVALRREERASDSRPFSRKTAEVLARAAHDLRNPISAITTSAELLQEACQGMGSFERELISSILSAGEVTLKLLADLLDLSLDRKGVLNVSSVDIAAVAGDCVVMHRGFAEQKGVRLKLIAAEPVVPILADRAKIFRAVSELLSSAIEVSIPGQTVEIGWGRAGRFVEIAVGDQGPAVSPEEAHHLFTPFSGGKQTEPARSRRARGLGLAIVNTIVRAHSGRVRVTSEAGQTRFSIAFPAARTRMHRRIRESKVSKAQSTG